MAGDEVYLETFEMISVELRDSSGNELNIDPNNQPNYVFLSPSLARDSTNYDSFVEF